MKRLGYGLFGSATSGSSGRFRAERDCTSDRCCLTASLMNLQAQLPFGSLT